MNHMIRDLKAGQTAELCPQAKNGDDIPTIAHLTRIEVVELSDDRATERLGADLGLALKPGDVVAILGDLGAGKTTLARAMIRAVVGEDLLEVPSPTFTLTQSYDGRVPLTHFDLYRLSEGAEIEELGFEEVLEDGAAIVEWSQRSQAVLARATIVVELEDNGIGGRRAAIAATGGAMKRVERTLAIRDFLGTVGYGDRVRRYFTGDASSRRYETIDANNARLVLMDWPAQPDGPPIRDGLPYSQIVHLAEDVQPFVALSNALREAGFNSPLVIEQDLDHGILLTSDLGTEGVLTDDRVPLPERYEAAIECLVRLNQAQIPNELPVSGSIVHRVPDYDRRALMMEAELLPDWYVPDALGRSVTPDEMDLFREVWNLVFDEIEDAERSLVLRDYHSPNILWQADAIGTARIGLIDFQDAMIGPSAYDVASLAQDARVTIPAELEASLVSAYVAERRRLDTDFKPFLFERDYAVMAAQRATKILGIFVRLAKRDGKTQYRRHIPRMIDYLNRSLDHPTLASVKSLYSDWGIVGKH